MNRQFQNYSKSGQSPVSYMERPNNQSQAQNSRVQNNIDMTSRNQAGPQKQIYNPNPFNSYDNLSMSSQMSSNLTTQSAISKPSTPSKERKEIGVLFYSNNCEHSKKFLISLMKTNFNELVRKICVDRKDVKVPSIVTSVPTLVARGINRPLVGEQVFAWLENETAKGAVSDEIKCYSFNCKDNFTFIDGGADDDTVVGGSVAEWDKDYSINAPMDVDDKKNSKKGVDKENETGHTNDMSKMQQERNAMLVQGKPKTTQLDPEEFNKMFLKKQQKSQTSNFKQNVRNI